MEETQFKHQIDVQNILKTHKNLDLDDYKPMLEEFQLNSTSIFDVENKGFYNTQDQKIVVVQKSPERAIIDRESKKRELLKSGIEDRALSPIRTAREIWKKIKQLPPHKHEDCPEQVLQSYQNIGVSGWNFISH